MTKAREILTDGMTVEIHQWQDSLNDFETDGTQICGHEKLAFADGNTPQIDTTDYCQAATGHKSYISGAKENGTLTLTMKRYDPKQAGVKKWNDAPIDTKFKLIATYSSGDKFSVQVQKKKGNPFEHSVGGIISGTIEMATISDVIWS